MNKYINVEVAKEYLRHNSFSNPYFRSQACQQAMDVLDTVPASDVIEIRHGKWIQKGRKIYCSKCNRGVYIGTDDEDLMQDEMRLRHFCSACGAKMDRE